MKICVSDQTIAKLTTMIENTKGGYISVRKYNKENDAITNMERGIKLSETQRIMHKNNLPYKVYISKENLKSVKGKFTGSVLPLIPLLLTGVTALGGLTAAGTNIAKTVLDKKYQMQN